MKDMLSQDLPNTAASPTPAALLPYQSAWVADKSPLKVAEKSRRIGLTWAEASDNVLIAASERTAGGMNCYYIGYNMDMAIEYIEACAMWARVFNRAAGEIEEGEEVFKEANEDRAIKTYTIRFASDFRIVALSSRPANLRGKQGVVVIDEAAFHQQLGELLKAALALLIWGGRVRVISTHDGDTNPFNELVKDINSGKRKGSVHKTTFMEAVNQGLYQRVCLRLGITWSTETESAWVQSVYDFYGDAASEELDVIPSQGSGAWLTAALIEKCMRPELPVLRYTAPQGFEAESDAHRTQVIDAWLNEHVKPLCEALDPDLKHGFGEDFGRSGDLTVIAPFSLQQNLTRRFPFIVELRNTPFRQQEQILFYIGERLPNLVKGALDGRGNGAALAEYAQQKCGVSIIEQILATEGWYREHMTPLKEAFEDGTIELPADADILNDLRSIKVIRGVPRVPDQRSTGADKAKRHSDSAIAIALAHYASRHPGAPIEFTAGVPRTRGFDESNTQDDDYCITEKGAW